MSKRKISAEDKIYAVNLYLDGKESQHQIASMFDVSTASVQQWIRNYVSMGADAFTLKGNKKYSKELKLQAVLDYLAERGSQDDICKKYGIRSKAKLQTWIKKYNGHEELKSSGTGGNLIMTKGRKTTFDERIEIVQYCIAHDHNYAETAKKYRVSYQQARSYTVKYEAGGVEALRDNRGKRKNPDRMDELEKLRAEVKILRAEKERAEMEASFLKKLEEIERRRG
jgi:transposase-like protein